MVRVIARALPGRLAASVDRSISRMMEPLGLPEPRRHGERGEEAPLHNREDGTRACLPRWRENDRPARQQPSRSATLPSSLRPATNTGTPPMRSASPRLSVPKGEWPLPKLTLEWSL